MEVELKGHKGQVPDKELEPRTQMSFRMKLLYTSIMLLIHHDFVSSFMCYNFKHKLNYTNFSF